MSRNNCDTGVISNDAVSIPSLNLSFKARSWVFNLFLMSLSFFYISFKMMMESLASFFYVLASLPGSGFK